MKRYGFMKGFAFVGLLALGAFLFGLLVMLLWNALMPALFGLPEVTYFQAVGLLVLIRLLVGGFHRRHRHGRCCGQYSGGGHWKERMRERFEQMSPEEKAKFKNAMRNKCGRRGFEPDPNPDSGPETEPAT